MPINILMPALSPTMERGQPRQVAEEGGRQGQVRRRHRRDRDRQGDDGGRGRRRGHARPRSSCRRHRGRAGQPADRAACRRRRGQGRAPAARQPPRLPRRGQGRSPQPAAAARAAAGGGRGSRARAAGRSGAAADGERTAGERVFASPLARRIAKEAGIDLAALHGSGPHGRVVKADVEARWRAAPPALRRGATAAAPAPRRGAGVAPACRTSRCRSCSAGLLRGSPARRHAQDHRAPADRGEADDPAFLPDARLRHRRAAGAARGDQCRRAEGQGRQAGLQALGQRLRHQGAGAGAAARAGRQCLLDRQRHAQAQACRCRRRRGDPGRADHADHPQGRDEDAVGHLQRDEGSRRRAPRTAS